MRDVDVPLQDMLFVNVVKDGAEEFNELAHIFKIDPSFLAQKEDIEISSRYQEDERQLSINLKFPYLRSEDARKEVEGELSRKSSQQFQRIHRQTIHIVLTHGLVLLIMTPDTQRVLTYYLGQKAMKLKSLHTHEEIFTLLIQMINDYYADVIQIIIDRVIVYSEKITEIKRVSENDLNFITHLNFSNMHMKESVIEIQKILLLLKTSSFLDHAQKNKLQLEYEDLLIVAEHIQFSFDRIDDLEENVSNKINLEQNRIMNIFTVITVCIAPPTLIAGIYGMNFQYMPELATRYGYYFSLASMVVVILIFLGYFKHKKWI